MATLDDSYMSVTDVLRHLQALKTSLKDSEEQKVKPNPEELRQFTHLVLSARDYHGMPTHWYEEVDPQSLAYPFAFQVLIQVNAVIAELKGKAPEMVPTKFSPDDKDGHTLTAALHQFFALARSLRECAERKVNLSPAELAHYKYVVVELQIAGYKLSPIVWDKTDPQSPTYPRPRQVLVQVNAAIADVLGLPVMAESNASDSAGSAAAVTPKGKPDLAALRRKYFRKQLAANEPLLSHDRVSDYRSAILAMIRETPDPAARRIILELLEQTKKLAEFFAAVRKAIKLVDEAQGDGAGRRATIDELLQALHTAKHSDGTSRQRFGLARLLLKKLDVPDEP